MHKARRVLIVDDDRCSRERLRSGFHSLGWDADLAETCSAAMAVAAISAPALLVIEPNLKERAAIRFLETLKKLIPTIEGVVITRCPSIANAVEAIRVGYRDYLPKPINWASVLRILDLQSAANDSSSRDAELAGLSLARLEWEHIHSVLSACDGNLSATARSLRIPRRSLQRKLHRNAPL